MGYSNTNCKNIHKISCEYFIDRFFCPENCKGFINKNGEVKNEVKETIIEEKINEKRKR